MKIKAFLIGLLLSLSAGLTFNMASPAVVSADAKADICSGIGASGTDCSGGGDASKILNGVVQIFSIVIGIAALIMMLYAAWQFINSGGDPTKVGGARSTIIYALVGLALAGFAQILVQFVLNKTTEAQQARTNINTIVKVEYSAVSVL